MRGKMARMRSMLLLLLEANEKLRVEAVVCDGIWHTQKPQAE